MLSHCLFCVDTSDSASFYLNNGIYSITLMMVLLRLLMSKYIELLYLGISPLWTKAALNLKVQVLLYQFYI
jgi:hypothetical protein